MSDEPVNGDDYRVGYGRPPRTSQWRKGQSGNPTGKSKKRKAESTFSSLLDEALNESVTVNEQGRRKAMTAMRLGIRKRVAAAAKGDLRALKEILRLRDAKEQGALAPDERVILSLEEARAVALPLATILNDPDAIFIREASPEDRIAGETAKPNRAARRRAMRARHRSVREIVDEELERCVWATDTTTGTKKRMTMRAAIARQLSRLFAANRPGSAELLLRLSQRPEAKPDLRPIILLPWDLEIPPPPAATISGTERAVPKTMN